MPWQWTISGFPEDVDRWISTREWKYSRAVRNKGNLVPLSGVLCKSSGRLCITVIVEKACLVDIFWNMNELNLGLQGKNNDFFRHIDKISAFMKTLPH